MAKRSKITNDNDFINVEEVKSVSEKIGEGAYKTAVPYPSSKDFEIVEIVETKNFGAKTYRKIDHDALKAARQKYGVDQGRLNDEFKHDCFVELGIENNPKRERCWDLAYEHGHSSGNSEIWLYLQDFADLIK